MNSSICILPSVATAEASGHDPGLAGVPWYTPHPAVVDWALARNRQATDLTELIDDNLVHASFDQAGALLDQVLAEGDTTVSPALCAAAGLPPVKLFKELFGYLGLYEVLAFLWYDAALAALRQDGVRQATVYRESAATSYFPPGCNSEPVTDWLHRHGLLRVDYRAAVPMPPASVPPLRSRLRQMAGRAKRRVAGLARLRGSRQDATALIVQPHYEFAGLPERLPKTAVWPCQGLPAGLARPKVEWSSLADFIPRLAPPDLDQPFDGYLRHLLRSRFHGYLRQRLQALLEPAVALIRCRRQRPFAFLAMDCPPIEGALAVVAASLRTTGVPLVVAQHGGSYGTQRTGRIHLESDYRRCDYFLSYGFTADDLPAGSLGQPPPRLIPVGCARQQRLRQQLLTTPLAGPRLDVLFPMTAALPLAHGMVRVRSAQLHAWQREILTALAASSCRTLVKLVPGGLAENRGHLEYLSRTPALTVADTPSFSEALRRDRPRLVILDLPSTPLGEALASPDTEILLLEDPVLPFLPAARQLLERRVHLYSTAAALIEGLRAFLAGTLPARRDDSFYRHYVVASDDPQARMLTLLRDLSVNPTPAATS